MNQKVVALWVITLLIIAANLRAEEPSCAFVRNLEAGKKQTLVVYGTSLTASGPWVKQLQMRFNEKFPNLLTILNGAQSGMTSDWGAKNVDERVVAKKPDAVLIEFGINDAVQRFNLSKDDCRANVTKIIDAIQKGAPECEIILMTMNCVAGENGAKRGGKLNEYYQVYRDIAKERKFLLIDHFVNWKALQAADSKRFNELVPDGVHPNAAACKEIIMPEFERVFFGRK